MHRAAFGSRWLPRRMGKWNFVSYGNRERMELGNFFFNVWENLFHFFLHVKPQLSQICMAINNRLYPHTVHAFNRQFMNICFIQEGKEEGSKWGKKKGRRIKPELTLTEKKNWEQKWDEAEYGHQDAYTLAWSPKYQLAAWPWPGGQHSLVEFGIQVKQLKGGNSPAAL